MVQTLNNHWFRVTMLLTTLMFGLTIATASAQDEPRAKETTPTESALSQTELNESTPTKYREFESTVEMDNSFLFLNGVYIPPTAELKFSNAGVEINGQIFDENAFDLSGYVDDRGGSRRGYGFRGRGERSDWGGRGDWGPRGGWGERDNGDNRRRESTREYLPRSPLMSLAGAFDPAGTGTVAVFYSGEAPMLLETSELGYELLKALLGRETPSKQRCCHSLRTSLTLNSGIAWFKTLKFHPNSPRELRKQ
ncbi:hypothetical protein [Novipirellula maiorica]|nr:hypothetical protein [Rhodopirellula maiorica]